MLILSSKIVIALISFVTTPVLARLFQPAEYGLFALVNSIVITLSLLSNLTLPVSLIMISENKLRTSVSSIFIYAVVTNVFFLFAGVVFMALFNNFVMFEILTLTPGLIVLLCIASFLLTLSQILGNLNIRQKEFEKNVTVNLLDNISIRISSLAFGLTGVTTFGLFYAEMIGKIVNVARQLWSGTHRVSQSIRERLTLETIFNTIKANKNYPLYNLPVTLLNNFTLQIVIWLIALFFTREYVGYLTMSLGFLSIPLLLLSNSLQPLVTRKLLDESSSQFFLSLSLKILLASILIYGLIFMLSPFFIEIYLGENWLPCISIIQVLSLPYMFLLFGSSVSGAFNVLNKQKHALIIKVFFLILLLVALYFTLTTSNNYTALTIVYAIVISAEEVTKILYLSLMFKNVTSRSVL